MPRTTAQLTIPVLGLLAGALAAMCLTLGVPDSADGATPCSRYGDTRPKNLSPKHARNAVICLVNKRRHANGRGGLRLDNRLQEAARKHSKRMARTGCFSHQCGSERSLEGRLKAVDYLVGSLTRWAYGENIRTGLKGAGTPRRAVKAWMDSPSHRSTLLDGTFEDIGAGFAHRGARAYYTADFGMRRR